MGFGVDLAGAAIDGATLAALWTGVGVPIMHAARVSLVETGTFTAVYALSQSGQAAVTRYSSLAGAALMREGPGR